MSFVSMLRNTVASLQQKAKDAIGWYKSLIGNVNTNAGGGSGGAGSPPVSIKKRSQPDIGKMYIFTYDPKWKDKLPFWDQYPLIFPIDTWEKGFIAINLHYLPPSDRAALLDALMSIATNDAITNERRLAISYSTLKQSATQFAGYEQCVKKYLWGHVRSSFHEIPPSEWGNVVVLPLQRWVINPNKKYASKGSPPY